MDETVKHTTSNLNITLGSFTIQTAFGLADSYLLRFIYGNKDYESGYFELTLSGQSNNTPSTTTSPNQPTTFTTSAILPTTTESTSTGTSSLTHVADSASSSEATIQSQNTPTASQNNGGGLSRETKVGIGIGCSVGGIIGAAGFFIWYRRMKSKPAPEERPNLPSAGPMEMELEGSSPPQKVFEVDGKHEAANLPELP